MREKTVSQLILNAKRQLTKNNNQHIDFIEGILGKLATNLGIDPSNSIAINSSFRSEAKSQRKKRLSLRKGRSRKGSASAVRASQQTDRTTCRTEQQSIST